MVQRDAFEKLLKREKLDELAIFIDDYESFEEFPLISRYTHLATFKKRINIGARNENKIDVETALIKFSSLYIDKINCHAKENLNPEDYDNFFCCLTFFYYRKKEYYYIPHFLISRKKQLFKSLSDNEISLSSQNYFYPIFAQLNIINSFRYFISKNDDPDLNRLYCLPIYHHKP